MTQARLPGKYSLVEEITINAPAPDVWDVLADFSAVDTWAPQVSRSYALGHRDRGLGAGRHCDIQGFGGIDETVTDWSEGRSLSYRVTPLGPLGISNSRWTVVDLGNARSKLIVEFSYDVRFGVLGRLMHVLLMRSKLERAFPQGPQALKTRVETGKPIRPRRAEAGAPQLPPIAS